MRLLSRRLALGPVLALALLTGCGGSSEPSGAASTEPSASAAPSDSAAVALVKASAGQTQEAGSVKVELTSETAVGDQTISFTGQGAFDPAAQRGVFDLDVPAAGGVIQQRIVDGTIYLALPQEPGVFYALDLAEVAGTALGGSTDPIAALQSLEAASDDVREVGTETVRDVETTHYTGTFDVAAAIEQAQGNTRTVLESTLGALDLDRVPFDVYLDEEGRVRRFAQRLELPGSEQTGGQALTSTTSVDVFDFGTQVDVAAPPAEQVKDGAPLLAALQGGGARPSPGPTG